MKIPLFVSKDAHMSKVTKTFQTGACHMAVVCENDKGALLLRNNADKLFAQI